mmetsp:Transcript_39758/g.119523  ORF Transcript_39758/g.119523 Transcript_39758/m.119523 type:complete len:369 (+) Transcript_39758:476-1582(+)
MAVNSSFFFMNPPRNGCRGCWSSLALILAISARASLPVSSSYFRICSSRQARAPRKPTSVKGKHFDCRSSLYDMALVILLGMLTSMPLSTLYMDVLTFRYMGISARRCRKKSEVEYPRDSRCFSRSAISLLWISNGSGGGRPLFFTSFMSTLSLLAVRARTCLSMSKQSVISSSLFSSRYSPLRARSSIMSAARATRPCTLRSSAFWRVLSRESRNLLRVTPSSQAIMPSMNTSRRVLFLGRTTTDTSASVSTSAPASAAPSPACAASPDASASTNATCRILFSRWTVAAAASMKVSCVVLFFRWTTADTSPSPACAVSLTRASSARRPGSSPISAIAVGPISAGFDDSDVGPPSPSARRTSTRRDVP